MSRKFKPGNHVICVDDDFELTKVRWHQRISASYPRRGQLYIIRKYLVGDPFPAVALKEIRNPRVAYSDNVVREAGFAEWRFEHAPDISELRRLLVCEPEEVL